MLPITQNALIPVSKCTLYNPQSLGDFLNCVVDEFVAHLFRNLMMP